MSEYQCTVDANTDIDTYLDLTLDSELLSARLKDMRVYLQRGGRFDERAASILEQKLQVIEEAYPATQYRGTRYDISSLVQAFRVTKQKIINKQSLWAKVQKYTRLVREPSYVNS